MALVDTWCFVNADVYVPDPKVADQLRHLYEHPDYVEMYPGIVAEEAKVPMVPGVGICPTYTISRAILSDAVTLVRSDRFYTVSAFPSLIKAKAKYNFPTVLQSVTLSRSTTIQRT